MTLAAAIAAALVLPPERFRAQDVVALPPPMEVSSGPVAPETQTYDRPVAEGLSPRNASYDIEVRLDPDTKSVTGRETLRWRNLSRNDATELQFHLYWNAWRNDDSTWMRGRSLTGGSRPRADAWGRIDVTRLRIRDAEGDADLTAGRRFIAPDDENADDRTVMAVSLPRAVAPNGSIEVEIEWTAQVPRPFARTGFIGNYYFFGQWFPKIGVFEDAGWNTHQFHGVSEFYADFGVYNVRMTVPRGWVVGASGLEVDRTDHADGTTTHRYRGEDIIDFAWTTSPDFVERREVFTHPSLPPVEMRLLLQPDHVSQAERHFRATAAALRFYGEWFGAYPYSHITIVDPAYQSRSGGMEYPTLFTAGTGWLNPALSPDPDEVTIHEVGHQWWYAVVATNEFEHAWMDEGINQFSDARTLEAAGLPDTLMYRFFGGFVPWVIPGIQLSRVDDGGGLARYQTQAEGDAQETPTYQYWPGTATATSYLKTNQWLMTLERDLGWPTVRAILRTYFERWKFRHPRPDDFF
ncbi:MAG: M1 family metallopeptidase, partial [Acidimicrobiia bacterium]|nr:M1 family metallopeptidase [Acidimicrobiia bacterium]